MIKKYKQYNESLLIESCGFSSCRDYEDSMKDIVDRTERYVEYVDEEEK